MKKILFVMLAMLMLVACGGEKKAESGAGGEAKPAEGKKIKVGVTIYKYDDNFMATLRKDMEAYAKEDSNVELIMNDSQNSQATQNEQVDALLSKGVNVLAINLVDPAAGQTIIDKAKAADVPVVFFNKDPGAEALKTYDKAYYVGTKPEESGIIQGQLIEKNWKADPKQDLNGDGVIQYVLLKGEPGHPDAEARTSFVIKELNGKGIKTEKLQEDTGMWDAAQAKDKMDAWLAGPTASKIEVVISNNDGMALGALEALKAHQKKLPVYGVDALQEALTLIESGDLAGTVLNDGTNQAKAVLDLSRNLANGKDPIEGTSWKLEEKAVRVPYVGVDKENLAQFKK
mgnify:CR=1 FL=1